MKKIKYLHCLLDDKFLDGAISLFDADGSIDNKYVLFQSGELRGIFNLIKSPKVTIASCNDFLSEVTQYDVVILHSLKCLPIRLITQIPEPIKVVWLMWGFDFYNSMVCDMDLLYPLTKNSLTLRHKIAKIRNKILFELPNKVNYKKALSRINYFSGVLPYEYDLFKHLRKNPNIKALPIDFYYGSTHFFVPEMPSKEVLNNHRNVIIGNSADLTNNTLDAFEILKSKLDSSSLDHIIVPLSYGGSKSYIGKVKSLGNEIWGDKLEPLDKYLSLEEYLKLTSNCKVAVYFHERQQASDNVYMQLMHGTRVYMSETSLMYQYLKKQGYHIFSLQKDVKLINEVLSYDEVMKNRVLLSNNYSSSKLVERVIKMNRVITQNIQ